MTSLLEQLSSVNVITQDNKINKQAQRLLQKYPHLIEGVRCATSFLYEDADIVTRIRCLLEGVTEQPCCIQCGKPLIPLRYKYDKQRFIYMCQNTKGTSCATANEDVMRKREDTLISKYGVTNPAHNKEVRDKVRNTNLSKYGGPAPASSLTIRQKIKDTVDAKTPQEQANIIQKRAATLTRTSGAGTHAQSLLSPKTLERVQQYSYDPEWLYDQHVNQSKTLTEIADFIGVTTTVISQRFKRLNIDVVRHIKSGGCSKEEQELLSFVIGLLGEDIEIQTNTRSIIPPKELDIYIPRYNIAIEYCGVYWHGESNGKDRLYHSLKREECAKQGIRLIQVWSSEWMYQRELVKSRLRNVFRKNTTAVYARKCTIQTVPTSEADAFFAAHHIQGKCSSPINYGLYHDGVHLVAVMSFAKDRFSNADRYELVRFAVAQHISVVGGAGKLFKAFLSDYNVNVVSYSDNRWNTGAVYQQLGFTLTHTSQPNYFYFDRLGDTNKLFSRHVFQKHKLTKKLELFDPMLTEWQNMQNNGYDRIWDCGNDVYVYNVNATDSGR